MLARAASAESAWPLAQEVYGSARLRPGLTEAEARVFAGGPATEARPLVDLADTREAITDDGPTARRLLGALTQEFALEGVFVLYPGAEGVERARPLVKVFVAGDAAAPAGHFVPVELRAESGEHPWASARSTLERLVPPASASSRPAASPPRAAARTEPAPSDKAEGSSAFYQSPWFWGAAGAALVLGGAFFLATRDSSSDSIHLEMQVPR